MSLFNILKVDNFNQIRSIPPRAVSNDAINTARNLDETKEIEPWLQAILYDTNHTPHGPSEIVDILTHKLVVQGKEGLNDPEKEE